MLNDSLTGSGEVHVGLDSEPAVDWTGSLASNRTYAEYYTPWPHLCSADAPTTFDDVSQTESKQAVNYSTSL
eukprot:183255-Hanusia_phi.AAC.1